ncbi:MAG: TIGR03545 family protein [Oligoflexia bacterium]
MVNKTPKKKGLFRIEAVGPFVIVALGVSAYFKFFFDGHLRRGMEWAATSVNGAEVNVAGLKTSFIKASIEISGVEFTDPVKPKLNRLVIGRIDFALRWDALLRGKFVIELAGVNGLDSQVPRSRPGRVLPPAESKDKFSLMETLKQRVAATPLGELANFIEGFDPVSQIKDLGNLKSVQHVESLKKDLESKQGEWAKQFDALPGADDVAQLKSRIGAVRLGGSPAEIPGQIQQLQETLSSAQKQISSVEKTGNQLAGDIGKFQAGIGAIDGLVDQDRKEIEGRLKLPSVDPKVIAQQMFGQMVLEKVGQAQAAVATARKYVPAKKKSDDRPAFISRPRGFGRAYEFGRPNAYPMFWLKRATFSAATGQEGKVKGELTHVTTSPSQVGHPARLDLEVSLPQRKIEGARLRAEVDARGDALAAKMLAEVRSFPVEALALSDSEQLRFSIAQASGSVAFEGGWRGDPTDFEISLQSAFRSAQYEVKSSSKILETVVSGVAQAVPDATVAAKVWGKVSDPEISIESNLAQALGSGLARQIQSQLAQARTKLDGMIRGQLEQKRAELQKQFDRARAEVSGRLESVRKQLESVQSEAQAKIAQVQKQAESALKGKALKSLKSKLPF